MPTLIPFFIWVIESGSNPVFVVVFTRVAYKIKMAYEKFRLAFIVVFVLLWLRRRRMERKRSLMARNIARRARILRFNTVQEEERAIFIDLYYIAFRLHA